PSNVSGASKASGPTKRPATPPSSTAWSRPVPPPPPAGRTTSRNVGPNGTSYTPGLPTWPDTQNSLVPVDIPLPVRANASPPSSTIGSALTSVSTLFATVGCPKRPTSTGKGGLLLGSPRYPSIELNSAVSSPQMY